MDKTFRILLAVAVLVAGTGISSSFAASMNDYCIMPPFIQQPPVPNLLLMIDNSASMYDLEYTDIANTYCANSPTTACTAGTTCAGAASCNASGVTTTTTSYSPTPCTSDAQCTASGSKCSSGFCSKCNANNGSGDCVSTTTTTFTPTSCTRDSDCQPPNANGVAGDTCNNKCNVSHQCYDATYSNSNTYSGYFNPSSVYSYNFATNVFTSGATMPSSTSCTYSAGSPLYLCVNTSGTPEAVVTTGSGFIASGNFLNWLTASKFDIEKQILTGGKFNTANNVLIEESRGCAGRKFLKAVTVTGANQIIFAIRGGTPGGIGSTQSQATEYGQTYIDIYSGTYNASSCLSAMNDWMNVNSVNLGTFQNDTKACVGAGNGVLNGVNVWNHILHDCYQGMTGGAQGYSTNLHSLEDECQSIYATISPAAMTDPNAGYAICSSSLTYLDSNGASQTGYLGACYNSATQSFNSPCDVTQMQNYCTVNVNTNPVVDPSSTTLVNNGQSAPGFIMEQGLMNTNLVGTLTAQVSATAPTGLIQNYQGRLRFGAMTFQNNGSASECGSSSIPCAKACSVTTTRMCYATSDCPTGETCQALAKSDGGQVISYIGAGACSVTTTQACNVDSDCSNLQPSGQTCVPSVGSHSSGLINTIDNIPATSWTPFAETFYNAIGYYARYNDPNYTTSPPQSRSDSNFNSLPSPNTASSYATTDNPSQYKCQANNILLVTDGMSTADQSSASEGLASLYASQVPYTIGSTTYMPGGSGYNSASVHGYDTVNKCPAYAGSRSISDLAWVAKNLNIKTLSTTTASTTAPQNSSEDITTYVVYSGPQSSGLPGLCDPYTLMANTALNGGTTLYPASSPSTLYSQLNSALEAAAAGTASGTAASVLSNSTGSGAVMLQALFYPYKYFDNNTGASWLGEMQDLWYYVDPFIGNSTVREDTSYPGSGNHYLDLKADYVTTFTFNGQQTNAYLQKDVNGNGTSLLPVTRSMDPRVGPSTPGQVSPDAVDSLWRAGRQLWQRNVTTSPRNLYTYLYGTSAPNRNGQTVTFSKNCLLNLVNVAGADGNGVCYYNNLTNDEKDIVQYLLNAATLSDAQNIISYAAGNDGVTLSTTSTPRSRTVQINSVDTTPRVWKLGDIIDSTPRAESSVPLNNYAQLPPAGYADTSYANDATQSGFAYSSTYLNRGMAFAGANDGMLHAFNLGQLTILNNGTQKAMLSGSNLGMENWAFIPRHVLPYLQYLVNPAYVNTNHLYLVDGTVRLVDASVGYSTPGCSQAQYYACPKDTSSTNNRSWRTILIGSMGIGGASRNGFDASGNPVTCVDSNNSPTCVKTPLPGIGYSSYFALDVTDPTKPQFLWEFSSDDLGYTTSGPAVVRINDIDTNGIPQPNHNGHWYAVFANGPMGPIDTNLHRFMGSSDKNLKVFVKDLLTGSDLRNNPATADPVIPHAFGGNISSAPIDVDRWSPTSGGFYSDNALYFGYSNLTNSSSWDGGVMRLLTHENPDPNQWTLTPLVQGTGPVTSAVAKIQDRLNHKLWLYFGSGRYYYNGDDTANQSYLVGVADPCYKSNDTLNPSAPDTCTNAITFNSSNLTNQTNSISSLGSTNGWYIALNGQDNINKLGAERVITDPVTLNNGAVIFTSYMPSSDQCGFGGQSYLWGVQYNTGGTTSAAAHNSQVLLQASTGAFSQVSLSSALTASQGRRTGTPITGKPPVDPPPVISGAGNKPYKRIIHVQEK